MKNKTKKVGLRKQTTSAMKKFNDSQRLKWCYQKTIDMMPVGFSMRFDDYCAKIDEDLMQSKIEVD